MLPIVARWIVEHLRPLVKPSGPTRTCHPDPVNTRSRHPILFRSSTDVLLPPGRFSSNIRDLRRPLSGPLPEHGAWRKALGFQGEGLRAPGGLVRVRGKRNPSRAPRHRHAAFIPILAPAVCLGHGPHPGERETAAISIAVRLRASWARPFVPRAGDRRRCPWCFALSGVCSADVSVARLASRCVPGGVSLRRSSNVKDRPR